MKTKESSRFFLPRSRAFEFFELPIDPLGVTPHPGAARCQHAVPAGQSLSFTVTFTPQVAGSSTGSLDFVSNASNSVGTEALTGSGSQSSQYSVNLSWDPSSSPVVGYNVYRGTQSGGPYQKLNPSPQPGTTYTDASVQSGVTYFYVATAVAPDLVESPHSNQTSATIP